MTQTPAQPLAQLDAIADCEARIGAAFARIGAGVAALQARSCASASVSDGALADERAANAALSERVRLLGEKQQTAVAGLERRLAEAEAELSRLRRLNRDLVEANRVLLAAEGDLNGPLADMALRAELCALRAERRLELTEIGAIVAAIDPLIASPASGAAVQPPADPTQEGADHA
ncbi:hypothetical protein [Paenirhodobacter enshiensis]|uniref:hypothetical protein n=1 Tax=Paenirhodobacter enshiensis TaxID=1105367 RepID=UPI003FA327FF